jgi:hypothetical protein
MIQDMFQAKDMTLIICCGCGTVFAIPNLFYEELQITHKSFYCPNGCKNHYPDKSEEDKLKDELEIKQDIITHLEARCNSMKGAYTKLKNKKGLTQ